jgi:hypothetical protein
MVVGSCVASSCAVLDAGGLHVALNLGAAQLPREDREVLQRRAARRLRPALCALAVVLTAQQERTTTVAFGFRRVSTPAKPESSLRMRLLCVWRWCVPGWIWANWAEQCSTPLT